jgi:hypothetical protein
MVVLLAACGDDIREKAAPQSPVGPVPAFDQRTGDPQRGWEALISEGYVGCGVPLTAYRQVFDPAPPHVRLPGRTGTNAELPFNMTAFKTASGIEVARSIGKAPAAAAAMRSAASPRTTSARPLWRSASTSGSYDPSLSRPPAMRTALGSRRPRSAATDAPTFVPFEAS